MSEELLSRHLTTSDVLNAADKVVNARAPKTYPAFLLELKQRIRSARLRASLSVNRELVLLYWSIGRDILARQSKEGWGTKVIDRLAADLRRAFPEMTGISARNLKYMRSLAEAWPDELIVQQVVAQLPWGHNTHLLDLVKCPAQREWYAQQTIEHGWSRSVLVHQIESHLFDRQGGAITNFDRTLPAEQSDLAQQLIKDPYAFDFLSLSPEMLRCLRVEGRRLQARVRREDEFLPLRNRRSSASPGRQPVYRDHSLQGSQ